jgi:hypothetical protein
MKKAIFIAILALRCLAEDKNYAVDISAGFSNAHAWFYPVPSLSFYWLKNKGNHELSGEFYSIFKKYNDPNQTEENHFGFGLSYSFLFKLPIKQLFVGPTIGFVTYEYYKTTLEQNNEFYLEDENGIYLAGFKIAYFVGNKTIKLKIQDRLLIGLRGDRKVRGFGIFNTINAGILIAI